MLLGSIALVGCATVHESFSADGKKAYALNCSGTARGWDKCLTSAGKQCGERGYTILERSGEEMIAGGGSATSWGVTKTTERTMLISCKD